MLWEEKFVMPTLPSKVQSDVSTGTQAPFDSNLEGMIKKIVDARVESLVDVRMQNNMNFVLDNFDLQNRVPIDPSCSGPKVDSAGKRVVIEGNDGSANATFTPPITTLTVDNTCDQCCSA